MAGGNEARGHAGTHLAHTQERDSQHRDLSTDGPAVTGAS
jgi:hypothetical protein